VIVSVLFGGTLLGVLGALMAVPVAATIQIAVREWADLRGIRPREDEPPEPPPGPPMEPPPLAPV
jgi:predicted PurR-regulated permease PerM